jgi:hypothetical protein
MGYTVRAGRSDAHDPVTGNGHILVGLQRAVARADYGHTTDDQVYAWLGWLICLHHRDGTAHAGRLWLPLVMMSLVGLLAFNFPVILPVLASQTFHGNGGTYGLLSTMLSVGSVAGSLGVGFIRHPRRPYLMTAALAFGASSPRPPELRMSLSRA